MRRIYFLVCLISGALLVGKSAYMIAKAELAQVLIAHAWQSRQNGDLPDKPWYWADTRPIAKLSIESAFENLYVMQDDSGESLAFGPGYLTASDRISSQGHVVISGHRDSHFTFLKDLKIGDYIETENYLGDIARYRINRIYTIDTQHETLTKHDDGRLTLITCYPFESIIPGGPLRYLVEAELIKLQPNLSSV